MAQTSEHAETTGPPAVQVELTVSCNNLKNISRSNSVNPVCILFTKEFGSDYFYEVDRTEVAINSPNPVFQKKFLLQYIFEECQRLNFEIYECADAQNLRLDKHDFLGRVSCTLGEVVGSQESEIEMELSGSGSECSSLRVSAEEISTPNEIAVMQFRAEKLDKKDLFGKSDPFLVFHRVNDDGSFTICHKSEIVKHNLNPTWKPFTIPLWKLCGCNWNRQIKVECYDWDAGGGHDVIGVFLTSLQRLSKGPGPENVYDCHNAKKASKKKNYKNSGMIIMLNCEIETQPSLLDYIRSGIHLKMALGVDFTASNGDPIQSTSLHYMNAYTSNCYARMMESIGEIVLDYDRDKQVLAFGYGARMPPENKALHDFPLNGNEKDPFCHGLEGVIDGYQRSLHRVTLFGPTNFAPIINKVAKYASEVKDTYYVLLLLTDGVVTDMPQTKQAIIQASGLPVSILIVGIGEADFTGMEEFDSDNNRLATQRDMCQFVTFKDYYAGGHNLDLSQAQLAKDLLWELPDQFLAYMKNNGIKPKMVHNAPAQIIHV